MEQEYINNILNFNADPEIVALREKYSEPSFFEIISKERSETTYSAFLKWIFQDCAIGKGTVSPVLQLLNILVKRDQEQRKNVNRQGIILIDDALRMAILSGSVQIKSTNVDTELSITEYKARVKENGGNLANTDRTSKNGEGRNQDRLDIFIDCEIEAIGNKKQLQIVIENKIDASEGDKQTQRYYDNTKRKDDDNIIQLYVYLSPQTNYEKIDKHFIQINYQDILDCIITPLLASNSISSRSRFFIEEFKNQLTYPNLDSKPCIAIGRENIDQFQTLFEKHKQLITRSAIAYSQMSFKEVDDAFQKCDNKKGCIQIEDDDSKILIPFWDENCKLLLAIMKGINNEKIQPLIDAVSGVKKKYVVKFNNQEYTTLGQGAKAIIEHITNNIGIAEKDFNDKMESLNYHYCSFPLIAELGFAQSNKKRYVPGEIHVFGKSMRVCNQWVGSEDKKDARNYFPKFITDMKKKFGIEATLEQI